MAAEARRRQAEEARLSDAAWEKARPLVEEWARKGRPWRPDADEPGDLIRASIPAFPGAWGGGMYTPGGRGGRVFVVTNLADRGPGTFREACEAGGPRIVVFNVAGIIRLESPVHIRAPYITIAGNTAPGDGVCIAGATVAIDTHDVIIRHLRFRRGQVWVGSRDDSLGGNPVGNIIIDHVSASWGLDENMSLYRHMYDHDNDPRTPALKLPTVNITIQYSIFSEALNTYNHAFGSTLGGLNSTFHHNLWACNSGRNPSVGMYGDFTFVNNVVFNWVHRTVDGGDHRSFFNIINNYYKPGPATPRDEPVAWRILKPESERSRTNLDNYGLAYVSGNVIEGNTRVTADNWDGGVQPEPVRDPLPAVLARIRTRAPFPHAPLRIQSAGEAYEEVLQNVGAYLPRRDPVDERILRMVRTGQSHGAKPWSGLDELLRSVGYNDNVIQRIRSLVPLGIITHPDEVGGYPEYRGEPYPDADSDGMPDEWERRHGLDPRNPADASTDLDGDGYTNIEAFLYGLDPRGPARDWTDLRNNVDPLLEARR
ncbi:pectate lyase family protein [Limisphaera sp. 4302-co]|uniref:pectate lyase family protein n=1 Tax=Limisphaera sp. 4302-co TaxID=3400417 RepID=UPI003C26C891